MRAGFPATRTVLGRVTGQRSSSPAVRESLRERVFVLCKTVH
jgi:hypothetical protein